MHRNFVIYVPARHADQWVQKATIKFTQWFGGTTRTNATGTYFNKFGQTMEEPITLIQSFASEMAYQQHQTEVYALARQIGTALGEKNVAVLDCGQLHFVDCDRSLSLAQAA